MEKFLSYPRHIKHFALVIALMLVITGGILVFGNARATEQNAAHAIVAGDQLAETVRYIPLTSLPGQEKVGTDKTTSYLQNLLLLGIGIAIVLAVLMIVIGGIQYMASDAFTAKEDAKEKITMALLGLLIALGGYLILYTINPKLVTFELPSGGLITTAGQKLNIDVKKPSPSLSQQIEQVSAGKPGDRVNLQREDGRPLGAATEVLDPSTNNGATLKVDIGSLATDKTAIAEAFQKQCAKIASDSGKPFEVRTTDRFFGVGGTTHICVPK